MQGAIHISWITFLSCTGENIYLFVILTHNFVQFLGALSEAQYYQNVMRVAFRIRATLVYYFYLNYSMHFSNICLCCKFDHFTEFMPWLACASDIGCCCISKNIEVVTWRPQEICFWKNNQHDDSRCCSSPGALIYIYFLKTFIAYHLCYFKLWRGNNCMFLFHCS